MKKYPNIDYAQRPNSYWGDQDVLACLLRDVKGTERRKLITRCWNEGTIDHMPEEFLKNALGEEAREKFGRIDPVCMGGEYLPDYEPGETEIARLELRSITADAISIRAKRDGGLIRYRIVDEYGTEFELQRLSSRKPLSLAEMVRFIDGSCHPDLSTGLALGYNDSNAGGGVTGRDELQNFTTVTSDVYPQLGEHYEQVFAEWAEEEA